jgi:hypothetical protein
MSSYFIKTSSQTIQASTSSRVYHTYLTLTPVKGKIVEYREKSQKSINGTSIICKDFVGADNQHAYVERREQYRPLESQSHPLLLVLAFYCSMKCHLLSSIFL